MRGSGPEQLDVPVGDLSGGEQARMRIAQLMLQPADLLLLDEPTNDLDIPALEVLEESLAEFPGALVLVSHDRDLLDRLCTEVVGLDGLGGAATPAREPDLWPGDDASEEEKDAWRKRCVPDYLPPEEEPAVVEEEQLSPTHDRLPSLETEVA